MDATETIAMARLGVLRNDGPPAPAAGAATARAELARLGLRLAESAVVRESLLQDVPAIVEAQRRARGQRGTFAPLFDGFPHDLPATDDVRLRYLLGAIRLLDVEEPTAEQVRAALDFTDLGWWPASSVPQDVDASRAARAVQELRELDLAVKWRDMRLVSGPDLLEELRDYMVAAFSSPVSLRQDVREDLAALAVTLGVEHIDPSVVTFRETRTLLTRLVWDRDPAAIVELGLTPDDLLRLMADLTGSDTSLAAKIRYPRLSRPQRRAVVAALESSPRLADVFRRRDLWLALSRGLHVGEHDAPATREVFARLRQTRHDHSSVLSRFETTLPVDYAGALELLVSEAPTVLIRAVRRLAALADADTQRSAVLTSAVRAASTQVPARVLRAARTQLTDNGATYPRMALTKTGAALNIEREPGHLAVSDDLRTQLVGALTHGIETDLLTRPSWEGQRIFIDPAASDILVPEALRTTAPGLVQIERGSSLPAGDGAVMRLFVHWRHAESDLDLSLVALDENFAPVAFVDWTRLRDGLVVHSGDITSAPDGAQEFLDVPMSYAREQVAAQGWRYLAPAIYRFSGVTFDELEEGTAGWMLREDANGDVATFDPATVVNAFELTGSGRTAVPFVLDIVAGRIVYLDVLLPGQVGARASQNGAELGSVARALVERRKLRTNVTELVTEHARVRGAQVVTDPDDATITVGLSSQDTYDLLHPEQLIADLV